MAAVILRIHDETSAGKRFNTVELRLVSERITARELIERRVRHEVEEHNSKQSEFFQGLIQPSDTEQILNGYKLKKKRHINADNQCEKAIEAFVSRGFFMLVGDMQVDDLDETIVIGDDTEVSFVKLVPLVGG